jgi:maltose alpha-D-glucosyltransferase/alpha-amylase
MGDFYVWADDDRGYPKTPIIFPDTETSNWAFDPIRRQYYWHRFYAHQPDLNYANPAVQDAALDALRFWLVLGVDGFRLDAVPYLYQSEETTCAHLPETHAFLKRIRATVDAAKQDCVLLAEANGFPGEVAEYFGDDDECHMAFNFPLMPRLFMALRRGDPSPTSSPTPRPGRPAANGRPSCATMTSSPWKWSPLKSATTCSPNTPKTRA